MNREESLKVPSNEILPDTASPETVVQRSLSVTPKYRYADLSQSGTEVLIEYEGQIYRLRTTRNGKLILIK